MRPGELSVKDAPGTTVYRRGLLSSTLNPKTLLVYLGVLPGFVDLARGVATQAALLSTVFIVLCGTVYGAVGLLVASAARRGALNMRGPIHRGRSGRPSHDFGGSRCCRVEGKHEIKNPTLEAFLDILREPYPDLETRFETETGADDHRLHAAAGARRPAIDHPRLAHCCPRRAAGTSARGQMARSCTSLPDEGPRRLDRLSRSAPIFPSTDGDPQISILVRWGDNWRL
jgi:hypothetical protein